MSYTFKMSGEDMNTLLAKLETVQTEIDNAYDVLETLIESVDSLSEWSGNSREAFSAYAHLMEQYHGSFVTGATDNPVEAGIRELKAHGARIDEFYDAKCYKRLEEI